MESSLYEATNRKFLCFEPRQQGGLLFLKLLLDKLVISNNSSLEKLILSTTSYDIKKEDPTKNIKAVTGILAGVTKTIISLRDDEEYPLPEKYVQKMLGVMQTTSVPAFNDNFKNLEDQLTFNQRLKATIESPILMHRMSSLQITTPSKDFILDSSLMRCLIRSKCFWCKGCK